MKKMLFFVLTTFLVTGCATTRYVTPGNGSTGATYAVEGGAVEMNRFEPGAQKRTNEVMELMNQAEESELLHQKAMTAIEEDMVLSPMPAATRGAYPVIMINRNRYEELTIVYWKQGFGGPEVEIKLAPSSTHVEHLQGGFYYFKVLDRNGRVQNMRRQVEIDPQTGRPWMFRPGPVNQFEVPKEYIYGQNTYWGKISIN